MTLEDGQQQVLIVTGMSGAGRSTVANALEDVGWYVVDNLPPQMLRPLVDLAEKATATLPRIAAVVDVRGRDFFGELSKIVESLRSRTELRVIFLEATDTALVRRFESVRRPHPLQGNGTLLDGISAERALLATIREASDLTINTSDLNIHQLATEITDTFSAASAARLQVRVESFGFKYGLPADADLVADARFVPNPFWVPELRALNGLDAAVISYVLSQPGAKEFIESFIHTLEPIFTGYQRESKRHATVAIGCTGGKHRSVAFAQEIASRITHLPGVAATVRHRDLGRE